MLILGLGGTGGLVAQRLKAFPEIAERTMSIRVFDQQDSRLSEVNPFSGLDRGEFYAIPAEGARQALRHVSSWREYLEWLPPGRDLREIDELVAQGGGGQRWLGRISFFAADVVIQNIIRTEVARLRERIGSELQRVGIVASLGGGTGSGLLADISYLVEYLAQRASRVAFLLLPGVGTTEPLRSQANAYAALKELYLLKYQKVSFSAQCPHLGGRKIAAGSCEPWHRLYLFSPSEGEGPPYPETLDRMARAVAAHAHRELNGRAVVQSQREVSLVALGELCERRLDLCFSTCELLYEVNLPAISQEEVESRREAEPEAPTLRDGGRTETGIDGADILRLFDIHLGSTIEKGMREIRAAIERETEDLEKRSDDAHRGGLTEVLQDLALLESAVSLAATPAPPAVTDEPTLPWWKSVGRLFRRSVRAKNLAAVSSGLESLPGFPEAQEEIRLGFKRYIAALPIYARGGDIIQVAVKFLQEFDMATPSSPDVVIDYKKTIRAQNESIEASYGLLRRLAVEGRCAALRAVVHHPEFRQRLKRKLLEWMIGMEDSLLTEAPAAGGEETDGISISAGDNPDRRVTEKKEPPVWRDRIESLFRSAQRNVFVTDRHGPSRAFAIVLIPEMMVREVGRHEAAKLLEKSSWEILDCHCEFVPTQEDRISIYYEDLFHSPCEIRHIDEWREAYLREPHRERLHIDTRFLAPSRFDELCARKENPSPVPCGNLGCDADIADLPSDVRTCPKCGQPIRSRCGNEGCSARDLHLRPNGIARSCPECGGFNHAAWWLCCEHGKVPVWVPTDKRLCPRCIKRHHEQPAEFPEASIGKRPHGQGAKECPNCRRLAETDSEHEVFHVPEDLVPFYERGVNGHDRRKVEILAEKYRLPDGYQCPVCRTTLIPVWEKQCPPIRRAETTPAS